MPEMTKYLDRRRTEVGRCRGQSDAVAMSPVGVPARLLAASVEGARPRWSPKSRRLIVPQRREESIVAIVARQDVFLTELGTGLGSRVRLVDTVKSRPPAFRWRPTCCAVGRVGQGPITFSRSRSRGLSSPWCRARGTRRCFTPQNWSRRRSGVGCWSWRGSQ